MKTKTQDSDWAKKTRGQFEAPKTGSIGSNYPMSQCSVKMIYRPPYFFKGGKYSKFIAATGISSFRLSVFAYLHRSVLNELLGLSLIRVAKIWAKIKLIVIVNWCIHNGCV
ncbi:MAG: hypothetical protein KKD21_05290 [Proteobacteria bacterium]|nr:hypothetical protein [Pseudomonadota bacterium]MBU1696445.1 hypothetical protein [Pseudomonadota bacterium]